MLSAIAKLLKLLNSEDSPNGIAWAMSLAFLFALIPSFSLAKWLLLLFVFIFRVHLSSFFLFSALFSALVWMLDAPLNALGNALLSHQALYGFWDSFVHMPFVQLLSVNNTLVIASFVIGVLFLWPVKWLSVMLVNQYREQLRDKVQKWRFVQLVQSSKIFQYYQSIK